MKAPDDCTCSLSACGEQLPELVPAEVATVKYEFCCGWGCKLQSEDLETWRNFLAKAWASWSRQPGTLVDGQQATSKWQWGLCAEQCASEIVDHEHFSRFLYPGEDSFKCTTAVTTHKALEKKKLQGQCLRIVSPMSPAGLYCCYAVIIVLTVAVIALSVALSLSVRKEKISIEIPEAGYATCPRDWIGFGSKCFYFSEHISNWTSSQTSCMELGAHLTHFDSLEELNFLNRYKGDSATWIGLHRESSEQPWIWTDNTEYNNLVPIRGEEEHAYLSNRGISSGRNYIHRKWICSKPNNYTFQWPGV